MKLNSYYLFVVYIYMCVYNFKVILLRTAVLVALASMNMLLLSGQEATPERALTRAKRAVTVL